MNEKFAVYRDLLIEWNEKINLTAITEPTEINIKHFEDSLTCLKSGYIKDGCRLVDVGTGAGFPGLPVKLENSTVSLTLMDSLNKRLLFLREVLDKTGVKAELVHIRAEEAGCSPMYRERFDVAVSRAVAALPVLCEYCLPLVRVGGYFLAMKSKSYEDELASAADIIGRLGGKLEAVQLHTLSDVEITHSIIVIKKLMPTPKGYPRRGKKLGK